MRVRSYIGLLVAVAAAVAASYWTHHNRSLFYEPFHVTSTSTIPLWIVLVLLFVAGLLPSATALLVQNLKRDLALRRERRAGREAESLRASFRRAVDYQVDGQWHRSAQELEAVLKGQPDHFSALQRYGEALRHLGRADEALEVHRRALANYPHSVALLYGLADDYEARGDAEIARETRARVLRDYPGFGLAVLRRRRNQAMALRDWEEAVRQQEAIETLLREAGDGAALSAESGVARGLAYQRGVRLLELDRVEEAAARFEELLAKEPMFIPAAIMHGEAELLRGSEEAALADWRRGYESTGSPVFLQRIEDHLIESSEPVRAIETLRSIIAASKNDVLPRFFLGRLYYRLEMHDEALRMLDSVGERILASPTYHFLLARIHERRGEMRKAAESYLACVRQLGIDKAEYRCRSCRMRFADWRDRCESCGTWNSIELDFEEEKVSAAELGIREAPMWSASDESGEFPQVELKRS